MKNLTPGEQIYVATQSSDIMSQIALQMIEAKELKKSRKVVANAKFKETMKSQPVAEKVIINESIQYSHARFGVGSLVNEDDSTITLSFEGKIKTLVKELNVLTKI